MIHLKTKILIGLSILFLIIITIGFSGIYFLNNLAEDSSAIIRENYASVDYSIKMIGALDSILVLCNQLTNKTIEANSKNSAAKNLTRHIKKFNENFTAQENNITEHGEKDVVEELKNRLNRFTERLFELLNGENTNPYLPKQIEDNYTQLRKSVQSVYDINMAAILHKNETAKNTAVTAIQYMVVIAGISLLLTISFILYFPRYIIFPIRELTQKIKAVADKNYNQSIGINSSDEIGELAKSFNKMSQKLREYENQHIDKLLLETNRFETLVQNLNDGVILLDQSDKVLIINESAQKLLGMNASQVTGQSMEELYNQNIILNKFKEVIKSNSGLSKPIDTKINGKQEYYNIEKVKITRQINELTSIKAGSLLLLKNITLFETRNLAKTNLLATVSHELKTPISSINLSLRLLEDDRIGITNEEQKKLLHSIKQQSKKLLNVVNELLDYSQIETGHIQLRISTIDPEQIIELATFALMMLMGEKEIDLEIEISKEMPKVRADLEKTVWVLVNILGNAIRFSPQKGKIIVGAKEHSGEVIFSVVDEGPGISNAEREQIFDKYVRADDKNKRGTGLGLAIAKEFVETQKGKIWIESTLGKGSAFFFSLPRV